MSRKKKTEEQAPDSVPETEAAPTIAANGAIIIRRDPGTNRLLCQWEGGPIIRCYDEFIRTMPKGLGGLDGDTLSIGQFTMRVVGRDETGVYAERIDEP